MALFFVMGIHLPFWPVWLADRGMSPERIGILLGVTMWARLVAPWTGGWADAHGRGSELVRGLAIALLVCLVAFQGAYGFWPLLALSIALGLAWAPMLPLVDGIALRAAASGRLDYGRVRMWGSASFILASVVGGMGLQGRDPSLVLTVLIAAALALAVASFWLPGSAPVQVRSGPRDVVGDLLGVLRRPGMGTLLLAVSFLQASHAVLYGFGTKQWLTVGVDESTIGWLWGVGVAAEVALFAIGQRIVTRFRSTGLLLAAGVGGLLRWPALALVDSVPALFLLQLLHAATFAAMHLGTMSWIRDTIEGPAVHRAIAIVVAVAGGFALGLTMPLAGELYDRLGGAAYHAMTLVSAIGLFFAWRLRRAEAR